MSRVSGFMLSRLTSLSRICARYVHSQPVVKPPPEGHGEIIWIYANRLSNNIIYSFRPAVEGYHALKQLTFAGKKSKPAKIRKDQWYPMAVVNFPKGQGNIGQSVFQKLRELKHLHEVSWSDDVFYHNPVEYNSKQKAQAAERHSSGGTYKITRHRRHRAKAIGHQRLNSIADMAAVLAGQGAGNAVKVIVEGAETGGLVPVTVSWANYEDREYAQKWSDNVTHEAFEKSVPAVGGEGSDDLIQLENTK